MKLPLLMVFEIIFKALRAMGKRFTLRRFGTDIDHLAPPKRSDDQNFKNELQCRNGLCLLMPSKKQQHTSIFLILLVN
jgi:hypothetical protein